jgi:hypothetical protein
MLRDQARERLRRAAGSLAYADTPPRRYADPFLPPRARAGSRNMAKKKRCRVTPYLPIRRYADPPTRRYVSPGSPFREHFPAINL